MMKLISAALLSLGVSAGAHAKGTNYFATVDGARYRVNVRGGEVRVFKKAVLVRYTLEERDRMRRAVKLATGCDAVDEMPNDAGHLHAKLSCQH